MDDDMFAPGGMCGPYVPPVVPVVALPAATAATAAAEAYNPDESLSLPPAIPPVAMPAALLPTPPADDARIAAWRQAVAAAQRRPPEREREPLSRPWSTTPRQWSQSQTRSRSRSPVLAVPARPRDDALVVIRQRHVDERGMGAVGAVTWFEFLLVLGRDKSTYLLPRGSAVMAALAGARHKHMIADSTDVARYRDVDASGAGVQVYVLPMAATQHPNPARKLTAPSSWVWATEAEVAGHVDVGPPSVLGVAVARWVVDAIAGLPLRLRFASATPPLVLYHGTSAKAADAVAACGKLLPSAVPAMCGPGVYLARWDKAASFALRDADGLPRPEPGVIVRCVVVPGRVRTLTKHDTCTCGCRRPCVDHHAVHAARFDTTFVPDGSTSASRAEWCVRNPDRVLVQGMFEVPSSQ